MTEEDRIVKFDEEIRRIVVIGSETRRIDCSINYRYEIRVRIKDRFNVEWKATNIREQYW